MQVSWKEKRKIWSGIPFSKPLQSVEPCLLFSFLFSQWYRAGIMERREKKCRDIPFFQNLYSTENRASNLISFFPHDTGCRNHGKKREKYAHAFHFFKTFTVQKTVPHIWFPFFPMIPGAGIMERRERNMVRHSIFSKPLQYRKPCLIFNFLFSPWYRVQESWKEEREIWSGIPSENRTRS